MSKFTCMVGDTTNPVYNNNNNNNDNNQRWAIWRELEPIGPTMLKNPCGAGGLLASYLPSYTKYDM